MVSEPSKPSPPPTALTAAQTPAASVQPSPFLPPLRVQIPTSASAATINLHLRPTSQPSPSLASQLLLLHPEAQIPTSASAATINLHLRAAAPSSSDSNLCECSHHQPPSQANLAAISVTMMADSLKEIAPVLTVPVPSPLYIGGKRKTRWILGKEPKLVESDPKFDEWVSDNCIILGWMFNSMEDRVYHMFMYHDTVHGLWTALTQMYAHAHNESRIFELYREISHASQTTLGLSVADYFGYLQTRWEELAQYEPLSDFPSDGAILNTSPLPSLYEAFAIVDGDERRRRLLPSPSKSPIIVPDQRAFAASSGTHLYCQHCPISPASWGWSWGGRSGGRGRGTPRTGAIAEVESIPTDLPDFKQLQLQIAQLQSHLGLAPTFPSSGPTAAIVAKTPTALHGPNFEIFAADNPMPPRPLPILEPSPPTPNDSLPPIDSQNPSPCAHAPLPASSLESGSRNVCEEERTNVDQRHREYEERRWWHQTINL
ncbi:hypothetical protein Acr_01g0010230 [Actinidia rufa]|uniref:Uncharacterized protein n=1 Tax=Actinidia rufa TaxID=165716 RepID=A0A7J0E3Y8_9ERIC|nr:hypothetical protein Acr_01g0010230 [Actinidia rufa]